MDPTKRCPLCGEIILTVAVRCRYCQGDLSQPFPKVVLAHETPPDASSTEGPSPPSSQGGAPDAPPASMLPMLPDTSERPVSLSEADFEQRFLEFVYTTDFVINAPTVAYALKVSIDEAAERLEDLAARDILLREVDSRGSVFFHLPGRQLIRQMGGMPGTMQFPAASASASPYAYPPAALVPYASGGLQPGDPRELMLAPSEGTALAALLVNTLCLPGLGSIIGGRSSAGIGQLLLFLIGIPLTLVFVGAPMILSAWIWALITGIDIMNQARQAQQSQRRPTS